jgi:phosphoenolpyruvate phosphomutase
VLVAVGAQVTTELHPPAGRSGADGLRELLASDRLLRIAGVHDALGARLAVSAGFPALWSSGLGICCSRGVPDCSTLPCHAFADAARTIAQAAPVPVLADADSGFGGAEAVGLAVHAFEAAGAAGICVEDAPYPKRNSFLPGEHPLVEVADFVAKLRAALAARQHASFVIVARTEALIGGRGLDEALARCRAYADAGADLVIPHSRASSVEEVMGVARRWDRPVPLGLIPTTYPELNDRYRDADLLAFGIKVLIYANQGLRAAVQAQSSAFRAMLDGGSASPLESHIASVSQVVSLFAQPIAETGQASDHAEAESRGETGGAEAALPTSIRASS